jgi:hypothetical protein
MQSSGSLTCFGSFEATVAESSLRVLVVETEVELELELEPMFSEVAVRLDRASSTSEPDDEPRSTKNRWEPHRSSG